MSKDFASNLGISYNIVLFFKTDDFFNDDGIVVVGGVISYIGLIVPDFITMVIYRLNHGRKAIHLKKGGTVRI
ncbi:hypothetical protein H5999_08160 [[Clostridium] spiroforme]|nr:hypothetical protein [Thomasclavelia spiroformis]